MKKEYDFYENKIPYQLFKPVDLNTDKVIILI